jgi:hypothetical protein
VLNEECGIELLEGSPIEIEREDEGITKWVEGF